MIVSNFVFTIQFLNSLEVMYRGSKIIMIITITNVVIYFWFVVISFTINVSYIIIGMFV